MTAERWKQVRDLFDSALDQPAEQREHFIAARAAGDVDLAASVRELLVSYQESSEDLISQPAAKGLEALLGDPARTKATTTTIRPAGTGARPSQPSQQDANPRTPSRIGPYRILGKIGPEGVAGAPSVLLAACDAWEPERRLAIRVFRASPDSARILPRFQRRRQSLTSLEHPNIARLIDAGNSAENLPYLVMEQVDGQPVDVYCQERGMEVNARLRLFITICQAVAHAHRAGVVHGDLRASKVAVTSEGLPKILEFGVAGLSAPEPDTAAADIRALGALMGVLLEGCRAGFGQGLAARLEAIAVKAAQPDPALQYSSAEDLAADVSACLAAPVSPMAVPLQPPARRSWRTVTAAALGLLLLATAAGSLFYGEQARRDLQDFAAQTIARLERLPAPTPETLDVLAQAYYAIGDRAKASETERKALLLLPPAAPNSPPSPLRRQLEANLARFTR